MPKTVFYLNSHQTLIHSYDEASLKSKDWFTDNNTINDAKIFASISYFENLTISDAYNK